MQNLAHPSGGLQLPVTKSNNSLNYCFRWLDDISAKHAQMIAVSLGGDESRILEIGYGLANPIFSRALGHTKPITHNTIILPCRNAKGEIIAIHDHKLRWLTAPAAVHIVNPLRARFAEIELCDTTAQADSIALTKNICCIARNGCSQRDVEAAILSARRCTNADTSDNRKKVAILSNRRLNHPHNPHTLKMADASERRAA